jgi:Zn-dependent protease/predicted transcriptional regulator
VGWSWKLGRIAGIDVYVHATFVLLLGWVAVSSYAQRQNADDVFLGLAFILCLFAIIVLHELGHALTARRYGIKTRDILLLPIGGVARLERMPDDPKQELLVALAGPAVNIVLAGIFLAVIVFAQIPVTPPKEMTPFGGNLLIQLFAANVFLAVFNLLPAFPMDGGRVLRALLAMRLEYVRATRIAAEVGKAMAIVFGFIGLMVNPFLLIIALFVWAGAEAEARSVQLRVGLAGVPVDRAMIREFTTLTPDTSLADAARHSLDVFQQDFPVVEGGKVVGILLQADLLRGLTEAGSEGRVGAFMRIDFETADPREMVEPVLERLKTKDSTVLPVLRDGELVGLLTPENVIELVQISEAVQSASVPGVPPTVEQAG